MSLKRKGTKSLLSLASEGEVVKKKTNMASYFGEYTDSLCVLGAVSMCYVALKVCSLILRVAYRTVRRCFPVDPKQYGRWAVVTGSTDGIGKSYALQLAEKGMDIVLISRNPQKLSDVAKQIVDQYRVSVKVIAADFTKTDIYDNIKQQLTGLDIGVLVNNVGMVNPRLPCYFCETEDFEQFNRDIINVNILSCVMMTGLVLPDMLQRKRGAIINLSSIAGLRPLACYQIYAATKAFVRFFSEALTMEYSSQGITIQAVNPGIVETNMTKSYHTFYPVWRLLYPTPEEFVRKALRTVGHEASTIAHWPHELQTHFQLMMIPDCILAPLLAQRRNEWVQILKEQ
ncbi:very-long-chain 3-oxoacyl-CoA reductase-like [Babylonia areolata]|uniref:very-long-chain 3-oxoacyl-CoA reductase-like n=1 Tax=Babylonia areolata TaxID=304850 RepID=UPI003FD5D95C